ncbi:MAG: tyrosine-type recombinase/integrase [Dechloromonas sp.]|nr:MAG: tyrosine-type recombinase/integrase [Dechloromonas sp.]
MQPSLQEHIGRAVSARRLPDEKSRAKAHRAGKEVCHANMGYRLDFHALRHTFASLLAEAQVSELARVKLARHSEWRQTDRYTDPQSIPLFAEMAKLAAILPSSIASPNSGKTCENLDKVVQTDPTDFAAQTPDFGGESALLHKAVPTWESLEMVPKGGLEPPCC